MSEAIEQVVGLVELDEDVAGLHVGALLHQPHDLRLGAEHRADLDRVLCFQKGLGQEMKAKAGSRSSESEGTAEAASGHGPGVHSPRVPSL